MVNYNDIAKIAKVSPTTVSHVINETRFVSDETKKRVLDAMKKLKYQPNLLARGLATGKTHTIGLVISDIKNPFYPELVQGVEELAIKNDYNVFLCNTDYDIEKGLKSTGALIRKKIDGIIVASSQADSFLIRELIESEIPFVLVDWGKRNINTDSLYFDYRVGIAEAISHLVSLGHKRIYFISGPKTLKTAKIRMRNFIDVVEKYKDDNLSYKILEGKKLQELIRSYLKPLMKESIDALILGCTHFPLIEKQIASCCGSDIEVINSAVETAKDVKKVLIREKLAAEANQKPERIFYETGNNSKFFEVGKMFLGEEIKEVVRVNLEI